MGRREIFRTIAIQIHRALIIGEDDNDVWLARFGKRGEQEKNDGKDGSHGPKLPGFMVLGEGEFY